MEDNGNVLKIALKNIHMYTVYILMYFDTVCR